jgi:phosphate uptake regulator
MLRTLLALFRKDSSLDEAFSQSHEMLSIALEMFQNSRACLWDSDCEKLDERVREMDKKVNKYERKVRKKVMQHLATSGTERLTSGLTLVSIIIDIERVGDYAKNIVQLAENHEPILHGGKTENDLKAVEKAVEDAFLRLLEILKTADEKSAEDLAKDYMWVNRFCDQHLLHFLREEDPSLNPGDAVTLALYFRYLKRIHSHLRNIATSIYRPFDKIGFVSAKVKAEGSYEPPLT